MAVDERVEAGVDSPISVLPSSPLERGARDWSILIVK